MERTSCTCDEPDFRIGPGFDPLFAPAVCLRCWDFRTLPWWEAGRWPAFTVEDYWENLDAIEGERAEEIRREHGRAA